MKNLLIFTAHADNDVPPPYVYHLLENIQASCHIVKTIFVWTGPELSTTAKALLGDENIEILHRENIGFDFASIKQVLRDGALDEDDYDGVFIANDSVYGPFNDLKTATKGHQQFDLWGVSDSWQGTYHLQTYFIYIRRSAFQTLQDFFSQYIEYTRHSDIVQHGEKKLTEWFMARGKVVGCNFPAEILIAHHIKTLPFSKRIFLRIAKRLFPSIKRKLLKKYSPSKKLWKTGLLHGKPFLKRKLLVRNKNLGRNQSEWLQAIKPRYTKAAKLAYSSVCSIRTLNNK